jgi:hypothetical protein
VHGTDDTSVPVADSLRLASSGSTDRVRACIEPGDDHRLTRSLPDAASLQRLVEQVLALRQ